MEYKIWLLLDDRPGNNSQSRGIAESLHRILPDSIIEPVQLSYNLWQKVPNFLITAQSTFIDDDSTDNIYNLIEQNTQTKHIVISTGRKQANISLWLSKQLSETIYDFILNIQTLRPDLSPDLFDLIVVPEHDKWTDSHNTLRIKTAPHNFQPADLETLLKQDTPLIKRYNNLDKQHDIIGILIGGSGKDYQPDQQTFMDHLEHIKKLQRSLNAHLFVTTSRRTEQWQLELLQSNLTMQTTLIPWTEDMDYNPYSDILNLSDYLIVTGDSISMMSESIATNAKEVFLLYDKSLPEKHKYMIKSLIDQEMMIYLNNKTLENNEFQQEHPRETYNSGIIIANKIKEIIESQT